MGTRSGDVDPNLLDFLARRLDWTLLRSQAFLTAEAACSEFPDSATTCALWLQAVKGGNARAGPRDRRILLPPGQSHPRPRRGPRSDRCGVFTGGYRRELLPGSSPERWKSFASWEPSSTRSSTSSTGNRRAAESPPRTPGFSHSWSHQRRTRYRPRNRAVPHPNPPSIIRHASHALSRTQRGQGRADLVALGLVRALDNRGVRVAFCKPIGQSSGKSADAERSTHFVRAATNLRPALPISLEKPSA